MTMVMMLMMLMMTIIVMVILLVTVIRVVVCGGQNEKQQTFTCLLAVRQVRTLDISQSNHHHRQLCIVSCHI